MKSISFLVNLLIVGDEDDTEIAIQEASKANARAFIRSLVAYIAGVILISVTADSILKVLGGCLLLLVAMTLSAKWGGMSSLYLISKTINGLRFGRKEHDNG